MIKIQKPSKMLVVSSFVMLWYVKFNLRFLNLLMSIFGHGFLDFTLMLVYRKFTQIENLTILYLPKWI